MNRYVIGNWKSNTDRAGALQLARAVNGVERGDVQVGIAPPFVWLDAIRSEFGDTETWLGAQTCSPNGQGAFTGEVTATMVSELCDFVLVGHSERRVHFGETNEIVRAKLNQALGAALVPVICVGETIRERDAGEAETTVGRQLGAALGDLATDQSAMIIAYEPVWAIGTGHAATVADASSMCRFIHMQVRNLMGRPLPVLYGGSVSSDNASDLIAATCIDGFLVGGASLRVADFAEIIGAAIVTPNQ